MSSEIIKILFVEDYHLIRVGITTYLDSIEDITVVAQADSAEEGLTKANEYLPDIVLMDIGLPKMNGIEATKILKMKHPEIKVIMLTSHQTDDTVVAALGAGANAYCLKGISPNRLVEVIRSVMDGAAWLDPMIANVALSLFSQPSLNHTAENVKHISLGDREREVLRLISLGKNNNEIADMLYISVHTVKSQVSTILQKLSVNDRVQAAVKAVTTGLVKLEE